MSKGILKFDLNDPHDSLAHKRAISATDMYISVNEFDNNLRSMLKYDELIGEGKKITLPEGEHIITEHESQLLYEVVSVIKSRLNKILEDNGIDMDDLE